MQIILLSLFFVLITAFFTHLTLSRITLTIRQRLRLIELYSDLFLSLKLNYKTKETPSLFLDKQDFLYFKCAFQQILPYIEGDKLWSSLSDWNMGMFVEHLIKAADKYPSSITAHFVEQKLYEIALRSCVLLFPKRINLFMHLHNQNGKFLVGDIDFTPIKEETLALLKEKTNPKINKHQKIQQNTQYIDVIKYLSNKNSFWPLVRIPI